MIDVLNELAGTWPHCVGDSEHPDLVGLSMIEVINEPDASLYNMLVGFYRQAIDSLRIVLESASIGAYCQLTAQGTTLQNWLDGTDKVTLNQALKGIQGAPQTKMLVEHLRREVSVGFADQAHRGMAYPGGWLRQMYEKLGHRMRANPPAHPADQRHQRR